MPVLFDDVVFVHYGFLWLSGVEHADGWPDLMDARAGQNNGLCGVAVPGWLSMITGTHTGSVRLTVDWQPQDPGFDDEWEDVVVASLDVMSGENALIVFDDAYDVVIPATGPHRVRYCALGMDAADANEAEDTTEDDPDAPGPDRYLLQLWPAASLDSDQVVRQSASHAQYWHDKARQTPALTPEQLADRTNEEHARLEQGRVTATVTRKDSWAAPGSAVELLMSERHGIHLRFVEMGPGERRAAACWFARRACEVTGLAQRDRVAAALADLEAGRPLREPFDHPHVAFALGRSEDEPTASFGWYDDGPDGSPASSAIQAVLAAGEPDEMSAVMMAFARAGEAYGAELMRLHSQFRDRFPGTA